MLYETSDSGLECGIDRICAGDWTSAQDLLTQRLEESFRLGRRRLNLFLLAVVASRVGLSDTAEQLLEAARQTPLEMGEPRYLGSGAEPDRRTLEQAWWEFNGWRMEQPLEQREEPRDADVDWAAVLDGALEGRAGELERRWSRFLDGDHPQRSILWNLVALGYLESGDPRTYDEMRSQAPSPDGPVEIPDSLSALLTHAGLHGALSDLKHGLWLTSERLTHSSSVEQGGIEGCARDQVWESEMEEAFSLLSVGRGLEAARKLGPLCTSGTHLEKAYAWNALALTLFLSGDYGGAEEALADGRREAQHARLDSAPELAARYAGWLASAGASPTPDSPFCDPFSEVLASSEASAEAGGSTPSFWTLFEQVLEGMRNGDIAASRRTLRTLFGDPSSKEVTRAFLVALLFAGTALLEGDHMETQDAIDDASRLLDKGGFEPGVLVEAQGRFAAAGAMNLARKMELEGLSGLDPWRDFPADFPGF